jgi:hypothetical protein
MNINTRGLNNESKIKKLIQFIKKEKFDIIKITETWLNKILTNE